MCSDRSPALRVLCAVMALLAVTACSGPSSTAPAVGDVAGNAASTAANYPMLRTELYFEQVDAQAWDDFLAEEVTPRFPDGLSWYDVNGQWRAPNGKPEKMPSRLLIVLHSDSEHNEQALREIAEHFHARFGSHVLVVSQPARARDGDWSGERVRDNPQLAPATGR